MKLYSLCPIHRNPELVIEQLINYKMFSSGVISHIFHVSISGRSNFDESFYESAIKNHDVTFCKNSRPTGWKTIMAALVEGSAHIDELEDGYVYIHTDGDLLVKGDLYDYVKKNKMAYSGGYPEKSWNWPHFENMINDERYKKIRRDLNIADSEMLVGRQEGSFFPIQTWKKIIAVISESYADDFFNNESMHWPIEEGVLPTLAKHFSRNVNKVRNVVLTKELVHSSKTGNPRDNELNSVSTDDIEKILIDESFDCVGIKWFSLNINDPARILVKKLGGYYANT